MKNIVLIFLFLGHFGMAQNTFKLSKKGITPKQTKVLMSSNSASVLFQKTKSWIESNQKKLSLETEKENTSLVFLSTRSDVKFSKTKSYYVKCWFSIQFKDDQYVFQPVKIEMKQNSKYDMGWKELSLENPYDFFKEIKGNKKSFLKKISEQINDVEQDLKSSLK